MKNLIISLFLMLSLGSCVQYYKLQVTGVDLTKFDNFLVSTTNIAAEYLPIAILEVNGTNGLFYKSGQKQGPQDFPVNKLCTIDELLTSLVSAAKAKGANGIVNLEIINKNNGLIVRGLAVKIK